MHIDERGNQWVYSACALAGLALAVALPSAKHRVPPDQRMKYAALQVLTLVGAIVGAKLAFLAGDLGWPRAHVTLDQVLFSGKSITGGLLGGFALAELGKVALSYTALPNDLFAARLPLSIAVGRVGCVLAGCCRGVPHASPLSLTYSDGVARFPAQLCELGFQLAALAVLLPLARARRLEGRVFAVYLASYGAFRVVMEALRDTPKTGGVSVYQVLSVVMIACGLASFAWYSRVVKRRSPAS